MNEKMIDKYNIRLDESKEKLLVDGRIGRSAKDKQYVKEHKSELIDILLKQEEQAEQKRQGRRKKIESIDGLAELEATIMEWNSYQNAMGRFIERDCTGIAPKKPSKTVEQLKGQYPRAAAYVKADRWSYSSHYYKASCGTRAKEAILNGEDYEAAIEDMQTAWRKYTEENID